MWRAGGGRVNRARFFRNLAGKPHRDEPRFALPFANGTRHGGPPTARATTRVAMRPCRLPQRLGKPAARLPTPAHPGTTHQPRSPTAGRRRRPFRRDIHCPASRREIHRPSTNARIQTDDALLADDRPEHSSPRPRSRCRCPRARRITPSPRPLPSRRETQRPSPAGRLVPCPPTLLAPT